METDWHNISAEDKFEENLTSPRFDEETKAAARPVIPLGSTHGTRATVHRVRNTWPSGMALILTICVAAGIAAILIYRNFGKSLPTDTSPTVSEVIIKAVPEPASLAPSTQPLSALEPETRVTQPKRMEPQRVLTAPDEPVEQDWKEAARRDNDEEKIVERARKEEKKRLKRQRKEAENLTEYERDSEESDRPKARLVGVYTVRRKY